MVSRIVNANTTWLGFALFTFFIAVMLAHISPVLADPVGNLTIIAYTYSGDPLVQGSEMPNIRLYYSNGTPLETKTAQTVEFVNISSGTYIVKIFWKGKLVYVNESVEVLENDNTILRARCNVTKVTFGITDDEGGEIEDDAHAVISDVQEVVKSDDSFLLPFGDYTVEKAFYSLALESGSLELELQPLGNTTFHVEGGAKTIVIKLPIRHEVTLKFYKLGSLPFKGSNHKYILKFKYEGEEHVVREKFLTNTNEVDLSCIPYGVYEVVLKIKNEEVGAQEFEITSSIVEVEITAAIIANLQLVFKDLDNKALSGETLTLKMPDGTTEEFILDQDGSTTIPNAKPGLYIFNITIHGVPYKDHFEVNSQTVDIVLMDGTWRENIEVNAREVLLKIENKGNEPIPSGANISVFYERKKIYSAITNTSVESELTLNLGRLPVGAAYSYLVEVKWSNLTLFREWLSVTDYLMQVDIYVKRVKLKVYTYDKRVLPQASITITLPNGSSKSLVTDYNGEVQVENVVKGGSTYRYDARVYLYGLKVGEKLFTYVDVKDAVEIVAYVGKVKVYLKGFMDKPIPRANVTLNIVLVNGTKLQLQKTTNDEGYAEFPYVPFAGGVEEINVVATYSRFIAKKSGIGLSVANPSETVNLEMDVVLLIPGLPLSTLEFIGLVAGLVFAVGAIIFVYRRLKLKKELSGFLSERAPRRRARARWEIEGENFFSRLKERLKLLRKGSPNEEEEEWDVFD